MSVRPPPPSFPAPSASRHFSRNLRNYQLAGHSPDSPWWATPLGVGIAVLIVVLLLVFVRL